MYVGHNFVASNVFIFMQLFVYFSSFSIKIAPCYGILGNNLLGMLKCLSLKYYTQKFWANGTSNGIQIRNCYIEL